MCVFFSVNFLFFAKYTSTIFFHITTNLYTYLLIRCNLIVFILFLWNYDFSLKNINPLCLYVILPTWCMRIFNCLFFFANLLSYSIFQLFVFSMVLLKLNCSFRRFAWNELNYILLYTLNCCNVNAFNSTSKGKNVEKLQTFPLNEAFWCVWKWETLLHKLGIIQHRKQVGKTEKCNDVDISFNKFLLKLLLSVHSNWSGEMSWCILSAQISNSSEEEFLLYKSECCRKIYSFKTRSTSLSLS